MALEAAFFINGLNASNPTITDQIDQGDDHIRLIKSTIKNTLPNLTGQVTLTHTEINGLPGDITALDTALNTTVTNGLALKAPLADPTFTGIAAADTPAAGTSTTQLATTAFVGTALTNFVASSTNIGNDSVALGTNTTGNYLSAVHGDIANSAGVPSITVAGTPGEGTDLGLELSYHLAPTSFVGAGIDIADFSGKKFLFVY